MQSFIDTQAIGLKVTIFISLIRSSLTLDELKQYLDFLDWFDSIGPLTKPEEWLSIDRSFIDFPRKAIPLLKQIIELPLP